MSRALTCLALSVIIGASALAFPARGEAQLAPDTPASPWQPLTNQPPFKPGAMLLLTDGTVIVHDAGPVNDEGSPNWGRLTPDINGSYVNGTWSQIASLPSGYAPRAFASAVLPDGRVIIEGGEYNGSSTPVWTNQGAIYDPLANTWTAVQPPTGSGWSLIGDAPSTVLADGTFMLGSCCSNGTALLNPTTLTWTATGGEAIAKGEQGWTLLPDGSVLSVDTDYPAGTCGTSSERYSPTTGLWSNAGSTIVQLAGCSGFIGEIGPQVLRPDGTVIAFGADDGTGVGHTAIFNTATLTWAVGPDLPVINGQNYLLPDSPAALLPSGDVLFAAEPPPSAPGVFHFFVFDGTSIRQVADPNINASRPQLLMLVLPTGQILFASYLGGVEIYTDSGQPNPAWAPVVTAVPTTVSTGVTYQLSGGQLNGLSQGAAYGDDYQSATNYPLVRIVNAATGHVFYARTFGHSSMSVAPNNPSTTNFTVPPIYAIETGPSSLYVVANGIASQPVSVTVVEGPVTAPPLVAAVLPSSRSVQVGHTATAFVTIINAASQPVPACTISLAGSVPATFTYQATDPATNAVAGSPNTPVNIAGWAAQSFVIGLTPTATFGPLPVSFTFACANVPAAPSVIGLNTLLLSSSTQPVPDIVALAATTQNDGILHISGTAGSNAFAVATVNVGASSAITATANTGSAALPLGITLCQTDPISGQCLATPGPSVSTTINGNATPTFGVFATAVGTVPFDPANNRIVVQFRDSGGVVRGSTSVAVETQ
jgi:hypothetical protein